MSISDIPWHMRTAVFIFIWEGKFSDMPQKTVPLVRRLHNKNSWHTGVIAEVKRHIDNSGCLYARKY